MSHRGTRWALRQRGLKPATKIVLFYLCDYHTDEKGCFPSQELLASVCEMSRSTLNLHLAKLEELGLIRRYGSVDERTRRQRPTRYILGFEYDFSGRKSDPGRALKSDNSVSENETRAVSGKQAEPCPIFDESRVRKPDTNSVKELFKETTTAREASKNVVAETLTRREEVLILIGCDTSGLRPDGKGWTGNTNDQQELPKWDALGLTRDEQNAKIREMLASKRAKQPGFIPSCWSYFTRGMESLADAKARPVARGTTAHPQTHEQRKKRRRRMIGG